MILAIARSTIGVESSVVGGLSATVTSSTAFASENMSRAR